ncbi:hypothetical protein GE09DRAFT_1216695 [Coniochaeta sp. 2T2.1]|nr:hypothetical protein GE09DRAFT_1216695 [Coniochaeta sp. 2T2.1]
MSDSRSTADHRPRHRSHRRRRADPNPEDSDLDSGYSTPASDTPSRATTTRSSRRHSQKRSRPDNAVVVRERKREENHRLQVQRIPGAYAASEYSDGHEEYTVGGDGRPRQGWGGQRVRGDREKDRDRDRDRGLLLVVAAFVVGLVFCLRASRRRDLRERYY